MTITDDNLHLRPIEKLIYDDGVRINNDPQSPRPFCFKDFPKINYGTFRNAISSMRAKELLYIVTPGSPTFYAIRGSGLRRGMTTSAMVGSSPPKGLNDILFRLGDEVACVHDVRLTFVAEKLYDMLKLIPLPNSGDKSIGFFRYDKKRTARVVVHRSNTVSVMIGCSGNPFPLDNLTDLFFILERVRERIQRDYTTLPVQIPLCSDWRIVQWHYNKDSGEISGDDLQVTFSEFNQVLYRLYSKSFADGRRVRLERIESPGRTLQEIASSILKPR